MNNVINGFVPHKHSPSEVGAAAESHKHSASDINSGVFPVERGGTGVSALEGSTGLMGALFGTAINAPEYIPIIGGGWVGNGYCTLGQLANAMGAARIFTGSYQGTDGVGASNPNILTFPFVPKMVIVIAQNSVFPGESYGFVWTGQGGGSLKFTLSGNTLSWYAATGDALKQLNSSSFTYYFVANG